MSKDPDYQMWRSAISGSEDDKEEPAPIIMKTYQDILNELARENSCNEWKYYFEKNKRSERSIREFCEEAARRFAAQ